MAALALSAACFRKHGRHALFGGRPGRVACGTGVASCSRRCCYGGDGHPCCPLPGRWWLPCSPCARPAATCAVSSGKRLLTVAYYLDPSVALGNRMLGGVLVLGSPACLGYGIGATGWRMWRRRARREP